MNTLIDMEWLKKAKNSDIQTWLNEIEGCFSYKIRDIQGFKKVLSCITDNKLVRVADCDNNGIIQ